MDGISGARVNANQLYTNNSTPRYNSEDIGSTGPQDANSVRNTCNLDVEKLAKELGFDPQFLGSKIDAVIAASDTLGSGTEQPPKTESGPVR